MNNGQYKRLIFSIIFVIILLGVTIVLLYAILNKPKDIQTNNYVGKDGQSIVGSQGIPGKSIVGAPGKDGINGTTVINNITTNVPVPGAKGDTGDVGNPSPQLLIKVDSITCIMSTKYEGDDLWRILAQLPKPCDVQETGSEQ